MYQIMKKHLLMCVMAAFAATAAAQYSQETALELQPGNNSCALTADNRVAYWAYTPEENTLLTVTPSSGSVSAYTLDGEGENASQVTLSGVFMQNLQQVYYLDKGTTAYFMVSGDTEANFNAELETGGNVGKGFSADDPVVITEGDEMFMGRSVFSSMGQITYATYSATEDGVLVLKATTSVNVSVNGGSQNYFEYSNGSYLYNLQVENGQTYSLTFSKHYTPFVLMVEMTHPEPGSLDMPFALAEGGNAVPAESGEYWYTYTNSKAGYGVISSESSLSRGDVKVYNSKYNIQSGYTYAQSAVGSYDVRFEMPTQGTTYFICVNKVMSSSEEDAFSFALEEYAPGDKEENPILVEEVPSTVTTKAAGGTSYYAVDVPAGVHKFLNVEATSEIASSATTVSAYPKGSSWSAVSGNTSVRLEVDGGVSGQQYIIRWTSSESTPITFTVSLDDIKQGDLITNPLTAVKGENKIEGNGTKYYTYKATMTGKLVLVATPEMIVTFPIDANPYAGTYQATVVGSTYTLGVTEGTDYYIKIDNAKDGDVFTLEEAEYEVGESRDNPFIVEGGLFTLGTDTYADYWLQYTVEEDGVLVIESDVPYTSGDQMMYGKSTDNYLSGMMTSVQDGEDYVTIYKVETAAVVGDVYLVNLKLTAPYEGKVVKFTIRDAEPGETVDNPIVLVPGETVAVPAVSRTKPMWYKASLDAGPVKITTDNYINGTWYEGRDNAVAGNGSSMMFNTTWNEDYTVMTNTWESTVATAGDYYIMVDQSYGNVNMTLEGTPTSISSAAVDGSSVSVSGNILSVSADNADVKVYTVSGAMVVNETVSGGASFSLDSGIYIVRINDTVKKVIVR